MAVYIFKNNQQTGPFTESQVLEMLANGQLSPNNLAIRQGDKQWQPLSVLFPQWQPQRQPISPVSSARNSPNNTSGPSMKILLALLGLVAVIFIGIIGILAIYFVSYQKTTVKSENSSNSSNINSGNTNTNPGNTNTRVANPAELNDKLKDFAKLKPPVKLEKKPVLSGKILIVEQSDRESEYSLKMPSGSEAAKYDIPTDQIAVNLAELDTLVQISCGKGREIGKYGPRMAYVPAYSNICNVAVINYREMKTIAKKSFVNGKKPVKIYVNDAENEYILDPPMEDVEKYLKELSKI